MYNIINPDKIEVGKPHEIFKSRGFLPFLQRVPTAVPKVGVYSFSNQGRPENTMLGPFFWGPCWVTRVENTRFSVVLMVDDG